jgi:hypothetical protein
MAYGLWPMVYGLWPIVYGFVAYGLWFLVYMAYGLWRSRRPMDDGQEFTVYGLGFMVYGLWFMVLWLMVYGIRRRRRPVHVGVGRRHPWPVPVPAHKGCTSAAQAAPLTAAFSCHYAVVVIQLPLYSCRSRSPERTAIQAAPLTAAASRAAASWAAACIGSIHPTDRGYGIRRRA